jgi:hypothetical protein
MHYLKKTGSIDEDIEFCELSNINLDKIKGENKVFSIYSVEKDLQMLKSKNVEEHTQKDFKVNPKQLSRGKTEEEFPHEKKSINSLKKPKQTMNSTKFTMTQLGV